MAVLAKISPILSALSQGMTGVNDAMQKMPARGANPLGSPSRETPGLGGLNLGNFGQRLQLPELGTSGGLGQSPSLGRTGLSLSDTMRDNNNMASYRSNGMMR